MHDAVARRETGPELPPDLLEVEVTRGSLVESRHRVLFAVSDTEGRMVRHGGDPEQPVYARSAIKPLQAIPLVETGAADAYGLGKAELALACASHNGEARHVETVAAWLERIGCGPDDLECGPQLPAREADLRAHFQAGGEADAIHNNCSGKHTGFLSVAKHLGHPTRGYVKYEHPVQQRILGVLESMTGLDLSNAPRGVDGCSIPVIGIPIGNMALAMARLGAPDDQPEPRQAACKRLREAMTAEPFMVAGTGRFCTEAMTVLGDKVPMKGGAEGVYCASLPELGLGIALKVLDGAGRASEVALGAILRELGVLSDEEEEKLSRQLVHPILNRAGLEVGVVRPGATPF